MFFQGTLQAAIDTALQRSKLVVCFVTDGGDESQQWESEFLADDSLKSPLADHAVALKLQAGSTEAGYLGAIFPLPKTPTLVMIKDGQLKEYIAAGVSKEDFVTRVRKALDAESAVTAEAVAATQESAAAETGDVQPSSDDSAAATGPPTSTETASTATTEQQPPGQVETLLAERAARLEMKRKEEAEEAKRRRVEKAKKQKAEAEAAGSGAPRASDPQGRHVEMLKKKQREAREERQRILKAIEDDKAARRARQSERQAERAAATGDAGEAASQNSERLQQQQQASSSASGRSEHCSIQVRLLDGSTLRNRFPSSNTLGRDIRKWVDENRQDGGGGRPYTFKVFLAPLPNRPIDATEEDQPLVDLGLAPSSTLILVPAPDRVGSVPAAYPSRASRNPVIWLFAFFRALLTGFVTAIVVFITSIFGTPSRPQAGAPPAEGAVASGRADGRMQGFQLRERRNDQQQYYNGNSVNFEPRNDDDVDENP